MKTKLIAALLAGILIGTFLGKTNWTSVQPEEGVEELEGHSDSLESDLVSIDAQKAIEFRELEEENYILTMKVEELESNLADYKEEENEKLKALREAKEKVIAESLKEYYALFALSEDQAYLIGEWEWEMAHYWRRFHSGEMTSKEPVPYFEDKVKGIFSPEQLEIYEKHLEEKHNSAVELTAQAQLSFYPTNINLSEDQKDKIYENLYYMHHKSTSDEYAEEVNQIRQSGRFNPGAEFQLIAARGVLSDEQLEELERQLSKSEP